MEEGYARPTPRPRTARGRVLARVCCGSALLAALGAQSADLSSRPPRAIRVGETREADLVDTDHGRIRPSLGPGHRWAIDGRAGERLTIGVESFELDSYLILFDPAGREIAFSDDSAGFSNACIRRQLPADGEYLLVVCGANADQRGTYWLTVREGDHEPDCSERAAAAYYRRGLAWATRRRSLRAESWINLVMGRYFRERGQWTQAEDCYTRSRTAAEKAGLLAGECAVALERGRLMTRRMRYDEAIRELLRALKLSDSLRAPEDVLAQACAGVGDLYQRIGRREIASVWYREALEATSPASPASTLARVYPSLVESSLAQDREGALEHAKRSLALRDAVDPAQSLTITVDWARMELLRGRSDEALRLAKEVGCASRLLGCRALEMAAFSLQSMVYSTTGRVGAMIDAARAAVQLARPEDEDTDPLRIALQMQATGEMRRKNYQAALDLDLDALGVTEMAWARETIPEIRHDCLAQSKAISTQAIRCLAALGDGYLSPEHARMAFDLAERGRCRMLLEELVQREVEVTVEGDAPGAKPQALLSRVSALSRRFALVQTAAGIDSTVLDQLEEDRARLVAHRMVIEARLRASDSPHSKRLSTLPLAAGQLQAAFFTHHPETVILSYQLGVQESFLILLTADGVHLFRLPDTGKIAELTRRWRAEIERQLQSPNDDTSSVRAYGEIAHLLYETLVRPAAPFIRARDIVIIPDGVLCDLAFEGLVISAAERPRSYRELHYLIEDNPISYAQSVTSLVEIERRERLRHPSGREMLLVGDAVLGPKDLPTSLSRIESAHRPGPPGTTGYTGILRAGLGRLPATREEVLSIAKLAEGDRWKPTVWLGSDASESKLRSAPLDQYRILHMATHAIADTMDGAFSGVVLSPTDGDKDDDGLLTAAEVGTLTLDADLVVLSGCSTGGGQQTHAEGILGLSRQFIVAGAQRVCASLWNVEDLSTQRLMTGLYAHLLRSPASPGSALRQAKIELLRSGAAPFYWASFVLVGAD